MLLAEPQRTQADLNFRLFGVHVRVHPFFWLISLVMGASGGNAEPKHVLVWTVAAFVSILVHEFGHAFAALSFGWRPWITLYGMGGLASYRPTHHDPRKQILISFAGPGAGFLLAILIVGLFKVSGNDIRFSFDWPYLVKWKFFLKGEMNNSLIEFIDSILFICIFWGCVNLLPVLPLDGGNICREFLLLVSRGNATAQALGISVVTGVAFAVYGLVVLHSMFLAMFFGFMAFQNFQALQIGGGGGYGRW